MYLRIIHIIRFWRIINANPDKEKNQNSLNIQKLNEFQEQLKNALQVLDILAANILGARSDGGKLGAIFGFNSTVNQLNPDMKLTEIEKDSANTLM